MSGVTSQASSVVADLLRKPHLHLITIAVLTIDFVLPKCFLRKHTGSLIRRRKTALNSTSNYSTRIGQVARGNPNKLQMSFRSDSD